MTDRLPTMAVMVEELRNWDHYPDDEALLQSLVLERLERGDLPELLKKRIETRCAMLVNAYPRTEEAFPEFASKEVYAQMRAADPLWQALGESEPANCRHEGGRDDCPPVCLLLYGDRYYEDIPLRDRIRAWWEAR